MRNRTRIHTVIGGLVLAFLLFIQTAPGFAQTRLAALPADSQVTLSWGPVEGASAYNLYFATEPDFNESSPGFTKLTGVTSPITQSGLVNGTKYFFAITAITALGEKPVSPDVPSTPSANVTAALAGANAFLSQLRSVINAHNPPAQSPSDLSYTHLTGLFDSAFLNEGRNSVHEAKRMAHEMRNSAAIESLAIDHVNFYDETNQIISVSGTVTIGGISEFVGGYQDGLFVLKRQADNATWLSYGDQRIVKGDFQVEMRTDSQLFYNAGPRQHVNFDIEAPIGTITSASVSVPGLALPLQLQQGQIRVETIVGDPAQQPEVIERNAFYGGFDPGTIVQAGTRYDLTVTKAAGGSATYPLVFHGVAVTDPVAGAINVTNSIGYTLADAQLGSPLAVQWTLPTAYPIAELRLDGWGGTQEFSCYVDNHAQMLPTTATSGTITLPPLCNGQPLTHAGFTVSARGENGQRSASMHGFSNQTAGGSSSTTSTTSTTTGESTTTTTGSTTTTTLNIPSATIVIDGVFSDWGTVSALATDPNDDSAADFGGDEIIRLFAAKDAQNLYLRLDLWESLNPNFGNGPSPNQGVYRFLVENNGSFPKLDLGVAYGVYSGQPDFGRWSLGYNGANGTAPAGLVGPSFVTVNGGRLDLRIPLASIGNPTAVKGIRAEVSDCCSPTHGQIVLDAVQAGTISPAGSTSTTGASTTTTTGSSTTTTGSTTTTTLGGSGAPVTLNFAAGWNLVGNSVNAVLGVAEAFGDAAKVSTVWKWVASTSKWAFYTPTLGDGGATYASGKGYDFLTSINAGEGFWVNAKAAFTAQLPSGAALSSGSFQSMASGWNLIAVGDNPSASAFNKALNLTPPAPGEVPVNLTTLWAWDSGQSNWYFYAPSLEKSGGLSAYILSKNYLDFGTKKLDPATGFWVNKP